MFLFGLHETGEIGLGGFDFGHSFVGLFLESRFDHAGARAADRPRVSQADIPR
jgi:hypothetical protein